jgi:hypothetical protein
MMYYFSAIFLITASAIYTIASASDEASFENNLLYSEYKKFYKLVESGEDLDRLWNILSVQEQSHALNHVQFFSQSEIKQAKADFITRTTKMLSGNVAGHEEYIKAGHGCLVLKLANDEDYLTKRIMVEYIKDRGNWKMNLIHFSFSTDNSEWNWQDYFSGVEENSVCRHRNWFS